MGSVPIRPTLHHWLHLFKHAFVWVRGQGQLSLRRAPAATPTASHSSWATSVLEARLEPVDLMPPNPDARNTISALGDASGPRRLNVLCADSRYLDPLIADRMPSCGDG